MCSFFCATLHKPTTFVQNFYSMTKFKDFKGIPFGFHFIRFWQAMLPTCLFDFIFGEVVGIYHGMEHFTGRK
jgi:hypothetical protein